MYQRRMDTWCV